MTFWTQKALDPKRAFKFRILIGSTAAGQLTSNIAWMATQADKPRFTVSNTQHRYLNHTFNYPGRVEWEAVNLTLVDPASPDAAAETMKILQAMGYEVPNNANEKMNIISKKDAVDALTSIKVQQLGEDSQTVIEEWTLNNAWIEGATFSQLSYESEDLSTIELVVRFDWASYSGGPGTTSYFTSGQQG